MLLIGSDASETYLWNPTENIIVSSSENTTIKEVHYLYQTGRNSSNPSGYIRIGKNKSRKAIIEFLS